MDWRDLARRQAGVIARRQLGELGLSDGDIRGLLAQGHIVRLLPGVYTARAAPATWTRRAWAAVLWSESPLSHRSAARMWDIPGPHPRTIHVTTGRALRRTAPGITVHRTELAADCIATFDGLPLTDRVTTIIDLLRSERGARARDLLDYSVRLGAVDADVLLDAVQREPGRVGNTALRKLVAGIEPGADAESERVLHRLLRRAGVTGSTPQYRVRLPSGRFAFIDIAFPEQRLAIEVDGRRSHGKDAAQFESDRTRQNELIAAGWRVLRFTWRNLRDDPDGVIRKIIQLLAA